MVVESNPDMEPALSGQATVHLSSVVVQDHENHAAKSVKKCTNPVLVVGPVSPGHRPQKYHPALHIGDNEFGLLKSQGLRGRSGMQGDALCYISPKPV